MRHRTRWTAALIVAMLVAGLPAAAEPTLTAPGDGAAETSVTPLEGRFVRVVIADRPSFGGREREEAYFVAAADGTMTLVGLAAIRYVDRDGDRRPDAGEVKDAGLLEPSAEAAGPRRVAPDAYLARAASAARRAAAAGELVADLRVRTRR